MKSLLQALEEGRLIELPEPNKEEALELLAHLIEAIPDIPTHADLLKGVLQRESQASTALGKGIACPHCRGSDNGQLLCAVGWSPEGIEYGAPDGKHVHLVVMYFVPDRDRSAYLKEISGLAKAISSSEESIESIANLTDIHAVRDKLLDWVSLLSSESKPDSVARMIKLESRQAMVTQEILPPGLRFLPFRFIHWQSSYIVLTSDPDLVRAIDQTPEVGALFTKSREFDIAHFRIAVLAETIYSMDRREVEAVALRLSSEVK